MRELIYAGKGKLEWRERPEPRLEAPTDALVRPVAATTCDLDKLIIGGRVPLDPPFAIGHECIGEVVEAGDGVGQARTGELVVVPWHIACGRCDRCRAGLTAHCRSVPPMAMFGAPIGGEWGGLFSDLVRVPWADAMLLPLPPGLDPSGDGVGRGQLVAGLAAGGAPSGRAAGGASANYEPRQHRPLCLRRRPRSGGL